MPSCTRRCPPQSVEGRIPDRVSAHEFPRVESDPRRRPSDCTLHSQAAGAPPSYGTPCPRVRQGGDGVLAAEGGVVDEICVTLVADRVHVGLKPARELGLTVLVDGPSSHGYIVRLPTPQSSDDAPALGRFGARLATDRGPAGRRPRVGVTQTQRGILALGRRRDHRCSRKLPSAPTRIAGH